MRLGLKVLVTLGLVVSHSTAWAKPDCECIAGNKNTEYGAEVVVDGKNCQWVKVSHCVKKDGGFFGGGECKKAVHVTTVRIEGEPNEISIDLKGMWQRGPETLKCDDEPITEEEEAEKAKDLSPNFFQSIGLG